MAATVPYSTVHTVLYSFRKTGQLILYIVSYEQFHSFIVKGQQCLRQRFNLRYTATLNTEADGYCPVHTVFAFCDIADDVEAIITIIASSSVFDSSSTQRKIVHQYLITFTHTVTSCNFVKLVSRSVTIFL